VADETQSVFDAALALSAEERARLAQLLLESLPEEQLESEEELLAELDRRREEVERGVAGAVPWSTLRDQE
jgi:putative addiction module component (TIGR02574 family)